MNMKKFTLMLLTTGLMLLSRLGFAENCPSITTLKMITHNTVNGWTLYNQDEGDVISDEQVKTFAQQVKHFTLASYLDGAPEGAAQCYYTGKTEGDDYLGVYLAKHGLVVDESHSSWVKDTGDSENYSCYAQQVADCSFASI